MVTGEGHHSINSDVYCMDYKAIKSSNRQNLLLNLNCLDNLSTQLV